jgi:hypothetical protein
VIEWLAGDSGMDTIAGFNLGEDHLYFGAGFFAVEPVGGVELEDVLFVVNSGADTILWANTAEYGWTNIATFSNVNAAQLDAAIENETILGPAPLGGLPGVSLGGFDLMI